MTFDEAMAAIRARAPSDDELLAGVVLLSPDARKEELAYQLLKWVKTNGSAEELAALGLSRAARAEPWPFMATLLQPR